ncbi:hypothetical protein MRX96_049519 [Rhipicephalus microplus]
MLSIMNASKVSPGRPVLLYSLSDTESLLGSLNDLPIPIKFVPTSVTSLCAEFYGYNSDHCGKELEIDNDFNKLPEYRLIFLLDTWSEVPKYTKKRFMQSTLEHKKNLIFASVKSHTGVRRDVFNAYCEVVTVTDADISAPEDRYRRCDSRKTVQASDLFTEDRSEGSFPKGHKLRVIMKDQKWGGRNLKPERLALVDAYR